MNLTEARKKIPSLAGLNDQDAVEVIHQAYYPHADKRELSKFLGVPMRETAAQSGEGAGVLRSAGDLGIKVAQGVVDLGSAVVGISSLATGGLVGKGMRAIGYDPERTNRVLGEYLSDSQKASDQEVAQADGFVDTVATSLANPRAISGAIAQSAPGMLAGMGVSGALAHGIRVKAALRTAEGARAGAAQLAAGKTAADAAKAALATPAGASAASAATKAATGRLIGAGAATEGAQTAGMVADRAQGAGREYGEYAAPALAAGAGTALIGLASGRLLGDVGTELATGTSAAARGGLASRVGKGFAAEGVLEEMPQSAQEQAFTNIAMGEEDVGKGVANAAATGLITGGVMGAGMRAVQGESGAARDGAAPAPAPVQLPNTGPLSQAANAGQAAAATRAAAQAAAPAATASVRQPSLDQIDARLAELVAIGHGALPQRVKDQAGATTVIPGVAGRRLSGAEIAEFNALKQARAQRVAIPPEQAAEYDGLLAEEQAAIDAKFEPAKAAAAAARDALEEAQIQAMLDDDARQAREAAAQREQDEIATTNAIIEHDRLQRAAANRAALRADVLADRSVPPDQKKEAFAAALVRDGYASATLTDDDHADIDAATTPVASLPNELIDAVPERQAPPARPTATNTRAVDEAIAAGMRLKSASGTVLHKRGSSKVFKLSTAQKAYYEQVMASREQASAVPDSIPSAPEPSDAAPEPTHSEPGDGRSLSQTDELVPDPTPVAESALDAAAHEAATSPLNDLAQPTEAQKEAGNYKVGRVKLHGMDLSIENPAGSTRTGVNRAGRPWKSTMQHHYGYIRGTVGADKDHVDVFIGPNHDSDKVFVVDQIHPDSGKFDEHKILLGFESFEAAHQGYHANYDETWTGGRAITETTVAGIKEWLASGKTKKPFGKLPPEPDERPMPADYTDNVNRGTLTKIELNRMTVGDMTDDQLMQAKTILGGGPRDPKITKEIARRGLAGAQTLEPTPAEQSDSPPAASATPAAKPGKAKVVKEAAPTLKTANEAPAEVAASIASFLPAITTWEQVKQAEDALHDLADTYHRAKDSAGAALARLAWDSVRIFKPLNEGDTSFKKEAERITEILTSLARQSTTIPAVQPETVAPSVDKFAANTIFTAEAAAKARQVLRSKLGQLNSGIDPEMMQAGIMLAGAHIESGARSFIAFSKAMIEDIGEGVRPYLRSFYEGVRHYPGIDGVGMTPGAEIDALPASTAVTPGEVELVIGKRPTAKKKTRAEPGNAALRLDYGIDHVDGYQGSEEFPVDRGGDYPRGGIKGAFLKDAQRYLKDVSGVLLDLGYAQATRRDGKAIKSIWTNEGGPAVGGEAALTMFNDDLGQGIYIQVGASAVRGTVPASRSGISILARITDRGDPYGGGQNLWMDPSMTARDLALQLADRAKRVAPRPDSDTLTDNASKDNNHGRSDTGGASAQALGNLASAADRAPQGAGRVGGSDADGSDAGAPPDSGSEGERPPAARGGRSGPEAVYPADAGAPAGRRLGGQGTGRAGKRVPKPDDGPRVGAPAPAASAPAPLIPAVNFRITEDVRLGQGGEVEKFNDNLAAIRTMREVEAGKRRATALEQAILARYVGWGGLANAFPSPETGEFKDAWKQRGPELAELLTPKEYALARRSTLDSHYTAKSVVDFMWSAARRLGFKGGLALESSMGAGNFIGLMPQDVAGNTKFIGVEYDNLTARIATLLYPRETVLNSGFQDVPLADGSFDLAIGNPPFGEQSLRFQFKPEVNGHSIHNQFFLASLDALKPGGLQAQVVSRYLLDKLDKSSRVMLAKKARLLGAIRLPDTAFKENARTSVVTDILFLQRLDAAQEAHMEAVFAAAASKPERLGTAENERQALAAQVPTWVGTTTAADPLGGEPMAINAYFASHPHMIMGVQERSGTMAHGRDITVRLDDPGTLAERLAAAIENLPQGVMATTQSGVDAAVARHKDMSDALRIVLAGHENGSIKFDAGALEQVVERETPEGAFELTRRTLSPASPWSDALYMNSSGQWYTIVAVLDDDGKPVKQVKDGKPTKLNVYDRKVFANESDIPAGMLLGQTRFERLRELVTLRDLLKEQLSMEAENAQDSAIEANRAAMAAAYQAFVKAHGLISDPATSALVASMPDGALVQALEFGYRPAISAARAARLGEAVRQASATPAPILSKRVIVPYEAPTTAASLADAVAINMAESGRVDIDRIAALLGQHGAQVEAELLAADKPLLFKDPETGLWVSRNEYLSGNVKRKLKAARAARMTGNVIALAEVQPEAWGAESVTALLGSSWVPPAVYADFVKHISGSDARVAFSAITNSYSVNGRVENRTNEEEWGSPGYTSVGLISDLLNNAQIKVMVYDNDGTAHVHQEHTALALLKAKAITAEFSDWVYKDGARRSQLVEIFNEKFNTRVNRQHDGAHLILPGKVPDHVIGMRRHQKNTIWRGITERFMLIDHAVGAGKTFEGIAIAMERRRMGLSKKPAIIVPNHMVEQFTSDVYRLYPGAKVLAAGKKDFEKRRRRKLFAKIATGDFDIVIIPHSSFGFIGIAPETEQRYLEQELVAAQAAVKEAEAEADASGQSGFRKPFGVKEAERLVDKITARMEKVAGDKSKDRLLTFEQLGIDHLIVDEAHEFKNLFYSSRLTGVKGMGNKTGSQKAFDLYNKVRVLREMKTGAVTFMTGTPISNSAVEMYNMMRYLAADELAELGLEHFDAWRAQFVSTDAGWEPTETGRLKEVNRLGRTWSNMRSLMDLYYSFTDSVDNDDIKKAYAEDNDGAQFPIPRVKGGERQSVVIAPTRAQIGLLEEVLQGFDDLPKEVDPYERNKKRLRLMDRARKVSLDVRAANPHSKSDEKGGKLDVLADNVKRIYDKWDADRGTQLVFLDRSVPKAKGDDAVLKEYDALVAAQAAAARDGNEAALRAAGEKLERFDANEMEELRNAQAGGWNAYQQIKDNLIARGIPASEIRFVQEANNDAQKQALFDAVNDGTVRVLIGSTPRMGAGTNVQQRLVAIHHADVTWKPSDIEQREGRGIRQGNQLLFKYGIDDFEIEILAYATERTIDAKMWALNASKLKTINAIRKYDGAFSMDFEDEDSVSMAELAALASGDPLLLERVKLMSDIDKLELLKRQHARKEWGITSQIDDAEAAIATFPGRIVAAERDLSAIRAGIAAMELDAAKRSVSVEGEHFSDGAAARSAVVAAVKEQQGGDDKKKVSINVNGRRLASLDGALGAVGSALGDQQTFLMTVAGKAMLARTDAARALAEIAAEVSDGLGENEAKTVDVGQFRGLPLQATMERDERAGYWTSLAVVREDGSTLATGDTKWRENASYTTSAMRTAVEDLEKTLDPAGLEYAIGNYTRRVAAAEAALPALRERKGGAFPQQGELEAKNARLEVVIRELSRGPATPARATVLRLNPLRDVDGSYRRQAPDTLMFSRPRIASDGQLVNVFSQLAQDDDAFRMPGSDAVTLQGVVEDMAPGIIVEDFFEPYGLVGKKDEGAPADRAWRLTSIGQGETQAWIYRHSRDKVVWLDISGWKEGQSGSAVYQAVATWAYNTGFRFIGDPGGLSDKALYRRTEHMISSALRHGTTKHLAPHERQVYTTDTDFGVPVRPFKWKEGEHAHNLHEMLVSSYTNILHVFPEIDSVEYNFSTARFERVTAPVRPSGADVLADEPAATEQTVPAGMGAGSDRGPAERASDGADEADRALARVDAVPFTDADFAATARSVRSAFDALFPSDRGAYTPPVGVSDLKRAVLTASVLREQGRDGGRAVLDRVAERLLQRVSPQLRRLLYSRDPEYFRDEANAFLPALPAGTDAGGAAPSVLSAPEMGRALKTTAELNQALAKNGMAPVRALRTAPNANFALARQVGRALGIDVNFVSNTGDFDGVAFNGVAYLTDGMRNPELAIAGHETLHALEQKNPELGARLRTQIRAYLRDGVVADRQMREYAANGLQDVSEEQAEAEVIADINGAMWLDPRFWSDLARADRSLFRLVAYKFMELASKAITTLRGSRFDAAQLVRDVDAVRAILVATWAEHAQGGALAQGATEAAFSGRDDGPGAALARQRDAARQFAVTALKYGGRAAYNRARAAGETVLSYAQWVMTRTPNFKRYYGDWERNNATNRDGSRNHQGLARLPDGGRANAGRDDDVARAAPTFPGQSGPVRAHGGAAPAAGGATVEPVVYYHGSRADVDAFDLNHPGRKDSGWLGTGVYVTTEVDDAESYARLKAGDAKPNIAPLFAAVRNPYIASVELKRRLSRATRAVIDAFTDQLSAAGHDGVVLNFADGSQELVAFDPAAMKSAVGNTGGFDAGSADIRFSRAGLADALSGAANRIADVRLPANYLVGDLFNQSGKLSWWHKTVGTMDNLAKRNPAFAPVYEAVQSFLGDVSRFAVVAADMAPTLLPKLENLSDILGAKRKKALTAADTKAIAAPIFEGTLVWARDAHGEPVKVAELEEQAARLTVAQKAQILLAKGVIDDEQNKAWLNSPLKFYDATIERHFEQSQLKAGVVWSDAELRAMFALNDAQIALYREFRAALDKSLANLTISEMVKLGGKDAHGMLEQAMAAPDLDAAGMLLRDHFVALAKMHPDQATMHLDTAKQILDLGDRGKDLMARGYAPLSRFGKHTVYVQDGDEQVYFGMFETAHEASRMARQMRADHPGAQVSEGTVSEDAYKLFAGVSPETIELFGSMVGLDSQADAASTEVYQAYLKLAKNNRSSMKRLIQRKGIAGFSEDAGRVLAGFIYSNARLTAGNAHLGEIDEAVTKIPKQQGELTDAAMQLREHIRSPAPGNRLGGLMFAQFLGGSVASAMVNLTQPFTMTMPFLSQYGGLAKAGARLGAAIKDAGKKHTGDANLDAALQWAADKGIVAPQEVHYLQAQAAGKGSLQAGDGTREGNARAHLNNALAKVTLGWGKLFAMAELTNRRITFIAAYRTAIAEAIPNPERFAQQAVAQTQGTYNSGNKPKWARGAIGGLLLTFKQYSIGYLELLSRMAFAGAPGSRERAAGRRAVLYMLAVLFLMSGADGLPFEQDLEDAIDALLQRLGYNFSSKRAKQAFLTEVLGQGGADFALKGISSMPDMPIDVAGRFGMGNLLPGTGLLTKKASYTADLGELAGPAGDVVKRAFAAAGKAAGGNLAGAALEISPVSLRNLAKGADMMATGAYKDARGYKVNDVSTVEAVMKGIGFQPNSTASIQDAKGQALNMLNQNRMRSAEIQEHWAQGLASGDPDMVQEAREWRDDWNSKNPETPVKVNLPAIIRRVRAMKQDALMRTQKTAPAALKQTVRNELAETRG